MADTPELDVMAFWTGGGEPDGPVLRMKEDAPPRQDLDRLFFSLDTFRIVGESQYFKIVSSQHWLDGRDVIYQYQLRPLKHPPAGAAA